MKVVFLCGHQSPYGLAHLVPILKSQFDISEVVLATDKRWDIFRASLSGKPIQEIQQRNRLYTYKRIAGKILINLPGNFAFKTKARRSIFSAQESAKKIARLLKTNNVSLKFTNDVNSENFINRLKIQKPDLILSAAFPQIFKRPLLRLPQIGCLNSHPSLLPRCRGAHPIFWAIASGEENSGVTAHYMTEELDNGDIVAQRGFPLLPSIRYNELYEQILFEIPSLIYDVEKFFLGGKRAGRTQNSAHATYFKNDRDIHHRIFFSIQTAQQIDRLVRASDGNASFFWAGKLIKVNQALPHEKNRNLTNKIEIPAGTVVDLNEKGPCFAAKKGFIQLNSIFIQGKSLKGINISNRLNWQIGMVIGN